MINQNLPELLQYVLSTTDGLLQRYGWLQFNNADDTEPIDVQYNSTIRTLYCTLRPNSSWRMAENGCQ